MNRLGRWDLFCKVVDNFGDIGVCWRLARQLAEEHQLTVRLWVDDLATFSHLIPALSLEEDSQHIGRVEVRRWSADFPATIAADVVIEAFACDLPDAYLQSMTQRPQAPIWINLEYLSAESWVEECHLLTSPHYRYPLTKHFFFPGFMEKTGGLIRERGLLDARTQFDAAEQEAFWMRLGIPARRVDETRVSLFCYPNPQLPDLFDTWSSSPQPVSVLTCAGAATDQAQSWLRESLPPGRAVQRGSLRLFSIPFLSQDLYDRLLWSCDVNFVRGEDSFVRAQWARKPFVWQIYPQEEGAHLVKLDAFLNSYLETFPDSDAVRRLWKLWNSDADPGGGIGLAWREFARNRERIETHAADWVGQLDRTENLADNLIRFVRAE